MKFCLAISILIGICSSIAPVLAQKPPSASACKTDPAFRAFDFWVGDWTVTNRANGKLAGTNKITLIEDGCALREEWINTAGGTGQSLNYYNPATGKWRQIWISAGSGGYSIDYDGTVKDGTMKMEGTIYYYAQGTTAPFRGAWTPEADGTVRQLFEQYDSTTKSWQVWFDGLYERKK